MKKYVLFSVIFVWSAVVCYCSGYAQHLDGTNYTNRQLPLVVHEKVDSSNVRLVGRWGHGSCGAVLAEDTLVYVGAGPGFRVMNVSDPSSPTVINGELAFPREITDIYISGNYAYVGANNLHVVDVLDPTNPVWVSYYYDPQNYGFKVYKSGNLVYTVGPGSFRIFDASDPYNLVQLSSAQGGLDIYVRGNYAFIAAYWSGLNIFDVSDPYNPELVGNCDTGEAHGIFVCDSLAYVADSREGLVIVDISDPSFPIRVGTCGVGSSYDVCVFRRYAYVAAHLYGVKIVNISNPYAPFETGSYGGFSFFAWRIDLQDNYVYAGVGGAGSEPNQLLILDVSDPYDPIKISSYNTGDEAENVYVSGNYAYIADGLYGGLRIVDIANPASPVEISYYDTLWDAQAICVSGGYAYVGTWGYGLHIIDIQNPMNPVKTGCYTCFHTIWSIQVFDNYAFMACDYDGLQVLDVSEPQNPVEVGSYQSGSTGDVYISGDYAYLANGNDGVRIVDISNPFNPVGVGHYTARGCKDIFVQGDYAYVITDGDLYILDVSDPHNPVYLSPYNFPTYALDIQVVANYAYVPCAYRGLKVINVSDPYYPTEVGQYWHYHSGNIFASTDYIYMVEYNWLDIFEFYGVGVEENLLKTPGNRMRIAPNPFIQQTTITYQLPARTKVSLKIYDITGRLVETLVNEEKQTGYYNVSFDAKGLMGGVYFVNLVVGDHKSTKKLILLR